MMMKCCFTFTETVGLLGTGAQDVHLIGMDLTGRCTVTIGMDLTGRCTVTIGMDLTGRCNETTSTVSCSSFGAQDGVGEPYTALYYTAVQYNKMQYNAVQYNAIHYNAVLWQCITCIHCNIIH